MLQIGEAAPAAPALKDHLGREIDLARFRGKSNVLLLFYPLDWTPT